MQLWLISASVNEPFVVGGLKLHTSCPLAIVGVPWVRLSVAFVKARSVIISDQFRLGQSGAPAIVRFIGRREVPEEPWSSPYRYSTTELSGWVPRLRALAGSSAEAHVLLDNSWGSDAVDNALELADLLRGDLDH